MITCKNCGTPYAGGSVCEKCGTNFTEEELKAAGVKKSGSNKGLIIAIVIIAVFFGIMFLGILAAIFVPAFIGYTKKAEEARERQYSAMISETAVVQEYDAVSMD